MAYPPYCFKVGTITTSTSLALPQIYIPRLSALGTPKTDHDRIVRVSFKEVTSSAPTIPVQLSARFNSDHSGITFGSELDLTADDPEQSSTVLSKVKLYSSGTASSGENGTIARQCYVNPRVTGSLDWVLLRGADYVTVWTPITTSAVTLWYQLYIGE